MTNGVKLSRLDKIALVMVAVAICLITLVAHSPFSIGLLIGAVLLAAYGFRVGQNDLIATAAFLPGFGLLAWWANYAVYLITPRTIDATLLRIDCGFAIAIWHWTLAHPFIYQLLSLVYYQLGIAAAIAICSSHRRPELLRTFVLAAFVAPVFYVLFPAVGPRWIGHGAARNCIPSLHFTWALLLLIYCSPRIRAAMWIFASLTAAATMGLGEHYAIDLVAALPFTAAVCVLERWLMRILRDRLPSQEPSNAAVAADGRFTATGDQVERAASAATRL